MRRCLSVVALAAVVLLSSGCDWRAGMERDSRLVESYAQDLPLWNGPGPDPRWKESVSGKGKAAVSAGGMAKSQPTVLYFKLLEYGLTDNPPLPMPGGWQFAMEFQTCLSARLTMTHQLTGSTDSMVVWLNRDESLRNRLMRCPREYALAWFVVAPNDRYFAFRTSDPGWVFFDRLRSRFLPLLVKDNQPISSSLYSSPAGEVLLSVMGYDGAMSVRSVVYEDQPLSGRFDPQDQLQVRKLNSELGCRVARASGERSCPLSN